MSADCQFPGCGNDATATYCEECRQAVRGPHPSAELDWISVGFLVMLMLAVAIIASAIVVSVGGVIGP